MTFCETSFSFTWFLSSSSSSSFAFAELGFLFCVDATLPISLWDTNVSSMAEAGAETATLPINPWDTIVLSMAGAETGVAGGCVFSG
jgi:hypothetical protein